MTARAGGKRAEAWTDEALSGGGISPVSRADSAGRGASGSLNEELERLI